MCYSLWYNAPIAGSLEVEELRFQSTGRQHCGCIIPQAVTHSLVLLVLFINNSNQLNMFWAMISPIFRSTRLCYSLWCNAPIAGSLEVEELRFQSTGRQHCGCIIPQAVTHSLVLLKMGIARNMLS